MIKKNIKDLTIEQLNEFVISNKFQKYRTEQILDEIYIRRQQNFDEMTLIPKELRIILSENFIINSFQDIKIRHSADKSVKFLFKLLDNKSIEAVYMPWENEDGSKIEWTTLCISTMSGCPLKCAFCATGTLGFIRNLSPAEIIDQILAVEKIMNIKLSNIVLMGMGEPLLNFQNVVNALSILTNTRLKLFSRRKITLSTAGIVPKIYEFAESQSPTKLAISLHATDNYTRQLLMPITKKYNISALMDAVEYYYRKTKIDVTYEYILFDGLNDTENDIKRLTKIARRVPSRVNIIPFNDISFTLPDGFSAQLKPASKDKMQEFAAKLKMNKVPVIIRDTFGSDIEAACGQLALSEEKIFHKKIIKEL